MPKLVGVYVRSREEHWAEVLGSVETSEAAVNGGVFNSCGSALPGPRIRPVYELEDGSLVFVEQTSEGFDTKPFPRGERFDAVESGGMAGGYMAMNESMPLPLAGGMGAAAWAEGYMGRVPEHVDLGEQQSRWLRATQRYADAVDQKTSPEQDEWRRQYFARIREKASDRDPIYRGPDAIAKGGNFYAKQDSWRQQEYHGDLFKEFATAAGKTRDASVRDRSDAPAGLFDHPSLSRMLALAGAVQKNGPGLPSTFFQALGSGASPQIAKALQAHLAEQAKAAGGKGMAIDRFRGALDLLKQLNEAGGGKLAAKLLENLIKGGQDAALEKLKGEFIKNLAEKGLNKGLEKLLGKEGAGILSDLGITSLFADAAKNLLGGKDSGLGDGLDKLMDDLPNKLIDMGMDKLIGKVDDRSSMAKQLLAKYKDQIKSLLKKLLSEDGLADLQKQWDAIWKGTPSSACVPLGLADPMTGPDMVLINGLPATRVGDICKWPMVPDAGPFFQGNPTITINGPFPSGAIHAARGVNNTIGTPLTLSPNVLMGEATVSLKIKIETESPEQERAKGGAGKGGAGAGKAGSGSKSSSDPNGIRASATRTPTASEKAEIDAALKSGDQQKAIDLATKYYGIDTTNVTGGVKYDPTESDYGSTGFDGKVKLGPSATSSPEVLASTIVHETTHANQAAANRTANTSLTDWPKGTVDYDESMAYQSEINSAKTTGVKNNKSEYALAVNRRDKHRNSLSPSQRPDYDKGKYPP